MAVWELANPASRLLRRFSRRDTCDSLIRSIISFAFNRVWLSDDLQMLDSIRPGSTFWLVAGILTGNTRCAAMGAWDRTITSNLGLALILRVFIKLSYKEMPHLANPASFTLRRTLV